MDPRASNDRSCVIKGQVRFAWDMSYVTRRRTDLRMSPKRENAAPSGLP